MKVVFLDYDGVVNTPMWDREGHIDYNHPSNGKVNNYQAIMWLNELLCKTGASIVVTSTWRFCCHKDKTYQDCLYNAGLKEKYKILGCTPVFGYPMRRKDEIEQYLNDHPEIDNFVILDDEYVYDGHLVQCDPYYGFGYRECIRAIEILNGNS